MKGTWIDLGRMEYRKAWDQQLAVLERVHAGDDDCLLLVEHDPVLTLGASFHEENLLHPREWYRHRSIAIEPTDRGGDVTYHGPGQLTIYPIFDLKRHGKDLHLWMRQLEETMIRVAAAVGVEAFRLPPHTGAWCGDPPLKYAAIGVKVKKWISIHGIALNCRGDLGIYEEFVPCGISEYGVTSLSQAAQRDVGLPEAKEATVRAFEDVFGLELAAGKLLAS
ncbi:MAG: Octanoyltransferase [Fimbriimonadaceae bacterium]|nr:Octanoyltransferase [Fimbriimonadaceae bacterium]